MFVFTISRYSFIHFCSKLLVLYSSCLIFMFYIWCNMYLFIAYCLQHSVFWNSIFLCSIKQSDLFLYTSCVWIIFDSFSIFLAWKFFYLSIFHLYIYSFLVDYFGLFLVWFYLVVVGFKLGVCCSYFNDDALLL